MTQPVDVETPDAHNSGTKPSNRRRIRERWGVLLLASLAGAWSTLSLAGWVNVTLGAVQTDADDGVVVRYFGWGNLFASGMAGGAALTVLAVVMSGRGRAGLLGVAAVLWGVGLGALVVVAGDVDARQLVIAAQILQLRQPFQGAGFAEVVAPGALVTDACALVLLGLAITQLATTRTVGYRLQALIGVILVAASSELPWTQPMLATGLRDGLRAADLQPPGASDSGWLADDITAVPLVLAAVVVVAAFGVLLHPPRSAVGCVGLATAAVITALLPDKGALGADLFGLGLLVIAAALVGTGWHARRNAGATVERQALDDERSPGPGQSQWWWAKGSAGVVAVLVVAVVTATVILHTGPRSPRPSPIPDLLPTVNPSLARLEPAMLPPEAIPQAPMLDTGSWVPPSLTPHCRLESRLGDLERNTTAVFQRVWSADLPDGAEPSTGMRVEHVIAAYRQVSAASAVGQVAAIHRRMIAEVEARGPVPLDVREDYLSCDLLYADESGSTWALDVELPPARPGLDAEWAYCMHVVAPAGRSGHACAAHLARRDLVSRLTVIVPGTSQEPTRALFDRLLTDAATRLVAAA